MRSREPSWPALDERLRAQRAIVETEFERVAWEAEGARAARRRPAAAPLGTPAISRRCLAGTPLAGEERAVDLLKDLRHGGLYQRMDEVGRQRLVGRHGSNAGSRGRPSRCAEVARARGAGISRRRAAQRVSRAAQRESGRARAVADARRRQLVARAANRRAAAAARRAARQPRLRHAAVARGARRAARAR